MKRQGRLLALPYAFVDRIIGSNGGGNFTYLR